MEVANFFFKIAGWSFVVLVVCGAIYWLAQSKQKEALDNERAEKGFITKINAGHIDGIKGFSKAAQEGFLSDYGLNLYVYADRVEFESTDDQGKRAILPINRIISAETYDENTITEKQKSVLGRAVAGGLLLGPVGAIVGGLSGLGNKEMVKNFRYLAINFTTEEAGVKKDKLALLFRKLNTEIGDVVCFVDVSKAINELTGYKEDDALEYSGEYEL